MSIKKDVLKEMYENFQVLVDEFNYEKNSIEDIKYFIKYLLFELYWQATKPEFNMKESVKKLKKDISHEKKGC